VSELIAAVRISQQTRTVADCQAADRDGDGGVAIGELIAAVNSSIEGCLRPFVIVVVGDSIAFGIDGPPGPAGELSIDPKGGFPGRLADLVGEGVEIVNRGLPGATTRMWLSRDSASSAYVRPYAAAFWPNVTLRAPGVASLLRVVLEADRPDVVLVVLGVNDLARGIEAPSDAAASGERLSTLAKDALGLAPEVRVSTILDNARDPQAAVDALNREIRMRFPDHLPLAERFAAAGGASLLGDTVHPSAAGHQALAEILVDLLRSSGILPERRGPPPPG
jgi:lysophospholipase L1-like esterase